MDAVRKTLLTLGLLAVNNKQNGGGCPKFYVAIEHTYSLKYSTGDGTNLTKFRWKNDEIEIHLFFCSPYVYSHFIAIFQLLTRFSVTSNKYLN
jgi:hypothetical protein